MFTVLCVNLFEHLLYGDKVGKENGLGKGGGAMSGWGNVDKIALFAFHEIHPLHNKKSLFSQFVKNCFKTKKNVKIIFVKSLRGQYDSQLILLWSFQE